MNPRPKWTPARRAFKEAPWQHSQRLPSRVSSSVAAAEPRRSVATAKSRPIPRKFGKPRGTRNPDTVDWKKAIRWEKRHGHEVVTPLEGPRQPWVRTSEHKSSQLPGVTGLTSGCSDCKVATTKVPRAQTQRCHPQLRLYHRVETGSTLQQGACPQLHQSPSQRPHSG